MADNDFRPAWFLRNAHLQTIWGRITRPRRLVHLRREVLTTADDDELVLDHLDAAADGRQHRPVRFILLHGLEGSSNSVYIQGMLDIIRRRGLAATVLNFRSCARDPRDHRRMLPNRRPRFYHSGETGDLDFVIRLLAAREPATRVLAFGASLGGNQLLKWLGENPEQKLVTAAVTVSVPYDLAAGAKHLETPLGRFYVARFVDTLAKKVERVIEHFPDTAARVDLGKVRRARTFREFDDAATAPLHGFENAEDYWARSSSISFLSRITTPVLCINAEDDPFLPPEVLDRVREVASPCVELLVTRHGGHVGFIGGMWPWRGLYWAEEKAVRWLLSQPIHLPLKTEN